MASTFQDRLVTELGLGGATAGATTTEANEEEANEEEANEEEANEEEANEEEANEEEAYEFLHEYLPRFNKRFAVAGEQQAPAGRPVPAD